MKKLSPALVYFLVLCAFFSFIASKIGFTETLFSVAVFTLAGIVPWYFLIARFAPIEGFFEQISISTVFTIVGMAFSGFLASWTGIHFLVFIPTISISVLGYLLLGIDPNGQLAKLKSSFFEIKSIHWLTLAGLTLITFAYLKNEYDSQPIKWDGVWSFYPDTLWQMSLIGENISKSAKYFPYLSGVDLSYPWGLHSFLGTWSYFVGISAAEALLVVWPALFALLAPLVFMVFGTKISGKYITGVLLVLALSTTGQIAISGGEIAASPFIYPVSPTYELGIVLLYSLGFLCICYLKEPIKFTSLVLLSALSFVSATSKASNGPLIVLALVIWIAINLSFKNQITKRLFIAQICILVSAVIGYGVTSSKGAGSITLDPLSFSPSNFINSAIISLSIILIYVLVLIGASITLMLNGVERAKVIGISLFVFGAITITSVLGHPGKSQLYFLWTSYPLLITLTIWALIVVAKKYQTMVVFGVLAIAWLTPQIWGILNISMPLIAKWEPILVLFSYLLVSITFIVTYLGNQGQKISVLLVISIATLGAVGIQTPKITPLNYSFQTDSTDSNALSYQDVELLSYLKSKSDPTDLIATDFHCTNDSISSQKCDGKYFAINAYSERRTIISGWAYTQLGDTPATSSVLNDNDRAVNNSSPENVDFLKQRKVKWLITHSSPNNQSELNKVAVPVKTGDKMTLWLINQ